MPYEKALSESERDRYTKLYCGICHSLTKRNGIFSKFTLSFDTAFLALVLSDVYGSDGENSGCCIARPLSFHKKYFDGEISEYCADMNIILAYYDLLDDWNDDRDIGAKLFSGILEKNFLFVCEKYPQKCERIKESLQRLSALENTGENNADTAADCFSEVLAEVFDYGKKGSKLKELGRALGKFIYILDACIDLKKDLKKKRYNPFSFACSYDRDAILTSLAAAVENSLSELPEAAEDGIVKNIVYTGIWTKYEIMKAREK